MDELTERLSRRFPAELEEAKPAPGGGRALTYLPGEVIIERLIGELGALGWSWRITRLDVEAHHVLVAGELSTPDGVVKAGCDCHPIHLREGATPQQIADAIGGAIKSAETGAIVRAARLLGVGLYVWRGGEPQEAEVEAKAAKADEAKRKRVERHRLLVALERERKRLGWTVEEAIEHCGAPPRQMDLGELSERVRALEGVAGPDPEADARRAALLECSRRLGWDAAGLDRQIRETLGVEPRQISGDGAEAMRKQILLSRARRIEGRMGWDRQRLVERLAGQPAEMASDALERALVVLEAEADEEEQ